MASAPIFLRIAETTASHRSSRISSWRRVSLSPFERPAKTMTFNLRLQISSLSPSTCSSRPSRSDLITTASFLRLRNPSQVLRLPSIRSIRFCRSFFAACFSVVIKSTTISCGKPKAFVAVTYRMISAVTKPFGRVLRLTRLAGVPL